jgi:hypothetical protein
MNANFEPNMSSMLDESFSEARGQRAERKAAKQAARQERRAVKTTGRVANRASRQERKMVKVKGRVKNNMAEPVEQVAEETIQSSQEEQSSPMPQPQETQNTTDTSMSSSEQVSMQSQDNVDASRENEGNFSGADGVEAKQAKGLSEKNKTLIKHSLIGAGLGSAGLLTFAHFNNGKMKGQYVKLGLIGLASGTIIAATISYFKNKSKNTVK